MAKNTPTYHEPWLHRLEICVNGNATALSTASGEITGDGAEGLLVDDARVLSVLTLRLGEEETVPLAQASAGAVSEFLGSARHLGTVGADPTVEVHRRRELARGLLTETVTITSRAADVVRTTAPIEVGGDGAEIPDVKAGAADGTAVAVVRPEGAGVAWDTARHTVSVTVTPSPAGWATAPGRPAAADLPLVLAPGGSVRVVVEVRLRRSAVTLFDAEPGAGAVAWTDVVRVTADDPRLAEAVSHSLADLQHLLITDPLDPRDVAVAAGTPWYLTLFGRDSLWTARMTLPLGTTLAAGTLRALARRQGTKDDPAGAQAPGKIPHEVRRVDYVSTSRGLALPPVYYGTIDATALWVSLLHDAWRWGMAEDEVRDLLPNLRAALGWLRAASAESADGFLRYHDETGTGLANQGWKDSMDAMRFRDGRVAEAPIALVEAQAYAVEAAAAAGTLLRTLGTAEDTALADAATAYGSALAHRIREDFWVGDGTRRWLAVAIDGRGAAVDGITSNMGHVLGTGALTADEAAIVTGALTGPHVLGRYGIATLSSDNGGYNPIGYHTGSIWVHDTAICALGMAREGQVDAAARVAATLLDAAEVFGYRYAELHADVGVLDLPAPYPPSCRPQAWSTAASVALLTIALGVEADVPGRRLRVRPPRPGPFGAVRVEGLRLGEASVAVAVSRDGAVSVEGLPGGFALDAPTP